MAGPKKLRGVGSPEIAAAISAILSMAAAGAASAQAADPAPAQPEATAPEEPVEEGGLNEVIVTATRRAERLQDVPESITALDGNAIAARGLQQLDDLAKSVPGLSLAVREPGGTSIIFRGVASSGVQFGSVSSSGLYLDEQPITQSGRSPDPRFIDIERIEALRGPQGTLYGASSQSGTLRVITNKPSKAGFESWGEAQVANTSGGGVSHDLSAMVNVPLADDKLTLRLVGFTSEDAGFIDNVLATSQGGTFTNADVADDDVNKVKTHGGRAALRWDMSDTVNTTLSAIFQNTKAEGHGDINEGRGDLHQVRFSNESLDDDWYQLGLTLNAALPIGDAVISASYFNRKFAYEADASDYEFAFNESGYVIYDFGGDPRGYATNNEKTTITTFEARLASPSTSESRWGWIVGAFYSTEKGDTTFKSHVLDYQDSPAFAYYSEVQEQLTGSPLAPTDAWFIGLYDTELDQVAVFGELSFDVTDRFTITAGGRWFDYERKFGQTQRSPEGFVGESALDGQQNNSEDGTVTKLNLTYKHNRNRMVYATYSEGFRVGGSNPLKPASALPQDYKSDTLKNFEIGAKTEWLDNRLRINLAAYYMKWEDIAVQIEDPQPNVFQLGYVNLPSADIPGAEADFAFSLNDQWQLDGAFSWNDAEVADAITFTVIGNNDIPYSFDVTKGARLPLTPDYTASFGLEFRPGGQIFGAQPYARFDYSYVGASVNSLEGIESVVSANPVEKQNAYQTGDLRLGLEGEHWSGSLFVDNIWDERAELFISNRWKVPREAINRPRMIGIQIRYDF